MAEQATGTEPTISDQAELDTLREGIDDPMVLKAQLAKEAEARRHLTARAKKAEEENRQLKATQIKAEPIEINQTPPPVTQINDEVVDLRLDGYSKQEVEWSIKNGGRKVLDDPNSFVTIAIKAQREQKAAENAANQVSSNIGLSEVERKYTREQLAAMSVKELEAILPRNS